MDGESRVQYYIPHPQRPTPAMFLALRTTGEPAQLTGALRNLVKGFDKDLPLHRVTTLEQLVAESMAQRRFAVTLLGVFAGLALTLAAVGLYGVLSYSITQRSHELGIRMALGARAADVLRLILRQGMLLALLGVAIGLTGAWILTRWMATLLFEVKPGDPLTFGAIALLLALVALLACFVPARRATKVDPIVALRCE